MQDAVGVGRLESPGSFEDDEDGQLGRQRAARHQFTPIDTLDELGSEIGLSIVVACGIDRHHVGMLHLRDEPGFGFEPEDALVVVAEAGL